MGSNRSSFEKLQRERDKRARAEAKRARRQDRDPTPEGELDPEPTSDAPQVGAEELLARVARLHDDFDAGRIDFETFEDRKLELMAQLPVD